MTVSDCCNLCSVSLSDSSAWVIASSSPAMAGYPNDLMEQGAATIQIDKHFKCEQEISEDEGAPFGDTFEVESESDAETAGNKRARVAGAFGAASSASSQEAPAAGTNQEAPAAGTKAHDEAYKSPDSWNWLKAWKAAPDSSNANSIVVGWRSGMESVDWDETGSLNEPLG